MSGPKIETTASPRIEPAEVNIVVVHGVGETQPGETLKCLMEGIRAKSPAASYAEHRRVFTLKEQDLARPDVVTEFPVYVEEATMPSGRRVAFTELFWADAARITDSQWRSFVAFTRIMFEAHHLVDGLLRGIKGILAQLYLAVLHVAAFLLRGPIAGLSINFIAVGLLLAFIEQAVGGIDRRLGLGGMLAVNADYTVIVLLLGILFLSARLIRGLGPERVYWIDVAAGTAIVGVLLIAYSVVKAVLWPEPEARVVDKFITYYPWLRYIWVPWSICIGLAILILLLAWPYNMLRRRRGRAGSMALALALVLLQSSMWLVLVPGASFVLINQIDLLGGLEEACRKGLRCTDLDKARQYQLELGAVFLVNMAALAVVGLSAWLVIRRRAGLARRFGSDVPRLTATIPRLVVSRRILTGIFIGATLVFVLLGIILAEGLESDFKVALPPQMQLVTYNDLFHAWYGNTVVDALFKLVMWTPVGFAIVWLWGALDAPVNNYAMTSARQILDHFFRPRLSVAGLLMRHRRPDRNERPRRERLQRRLDGAIACLPPPRRKDGTPGVTLFLAHSQGTMVVFEHLKRTLAAGPPPHPIHVVTLGSPLGNIYETYSEEYRDLAQTIAGMRASIASWTNIYRADDPIAGPVAAEPAGLVANEAHPVGPFSHMYYWNDARVCDVVVRLIEGPSDAAEAPVREAT